MKDCHINVDSKLCGCRRCQFSVLFKMLISKIKGNVSRILTYLCRQSLKWKSIILVTQKVI